MKIFFYLLVSCPAFLSSAPAADSPASLATELRNSFAENDPSVLANRKVFTLITGDIPIGSYRAGDPDGLLRPLPNLYEIASVSVLTLAEARSIEEKGYAKGSHEGYVAVDFVRRENSNPKAQITAFRRYYPYEQAAGRYVLISAQ